jgi:hypothetical protein
MKYADNDEGIHTSEYFKAIYTDFGYGDSTVLILNAPAISIGGLLSVYGDSVTTESDLRVMGTIYEGGTALSSKYLGINANAASATKLNTARTLTIGSTGKSFNGTANVSWSLSEIGAAASSHTHSYLPLSGGTLTGSTMLNQSSSTSTYRIGVLNKNNNMDLRASTNCGLYHTDDSGYSTSGWMIYMSTAGAITTNTKSDRRMKDYISDLSEEESLALLTEVNPILYTLKGDSEHQKEEISSGFFAQDVRDVLINHNIGYRTYLLIHKNDSDEDTYDLTTDENTVNYGLDYSKFVPTLWKGWQIHQKEIESLKSEISELKDLVNELLNKQ